MAPATFTQTQQSADPCATPSAAVRLPGTWKLVPGRAITLEPREEGTLKVAHGQVWATYDGPHRGPRNNLGDHIVGMGGQLRIRAGERVVVESWGTKSAAYFSWDPLPVRVQVSEPNFARVMQPLADLRLAVVFGLQAIGRLATGVAVIALESIGRRRVVAVGAHAFNPPCAPCGPTRALG